MTPVTIVILNWNGKKFLRQFLPSVLATDYPAMQVLVADNGSSDDSLEILRNEFPAVQVLDLKENHGFAQGNNLALAEVKTPYYVLLNNDVEVPAGWLKPLVELMDSDPQIAAVQPKLLAFDEKDRFEYAGGAGGFVDRYGYAFCRGRIFDAHEKDHGQYDGVEEIFWATGACILIRKAVSDRIGLFEAAFFAHQEEIDFCWRAKNFGYKVMATSKSIAYHVGGGTLNRSSPKKTFLNARNNLVLLIRNLPTGKVFGTVWMRACLDGVWAMRSVVRLDFMTVWVILKAHWAVWLRLGYWLRKRKEIYRELPAVPQQVKGWYAHSIVWQHFGRGVKKFSELKGIK